MTQVFLSECARMSVHEWVPPGMMGNLALVITQDARTDILLARLVDRELLTHLKTQPLGEAFPGLEVVLFGVDAVPPQSVFELIALPVHGPQTHIPGCPDLHTNVLLRVVVHPNRTPIRMAGRRLNLHNRYPQVQASGTSLAVKSASIS